MAEQTAVNRQAGGSSPPPGGVCGCGCCDGSSLSATCAPYYPECNQPQQQYVASQPVIEYKNEVITEQINFATTKQNDPTLDKGKTSIKQEGVMGSKEITYKTTLTDGTETNREKIDEKIVINPVDKIILVGTKETKQPEVAGVTTDGKKTSIGSIILWILIVGGLIGLAIWGIYKSVKK